MRFIPLSILLFTLYSCSSPSVQETVPMVTKDNDTIQPCRHVNTFKTADEYFSDANNKTKDCWGDSLACAAALKEYARAVELNPGFWQARRNYGRMLCGFKRYTDAITQYTEAMKHSDDADLNIGRAFAYYNLQRYKEAVNDYNIALKVGMDIQYCLSWKAKAEWLMGNKDSACADYHRALAIDTTNKKAMEFIKCN